MEQNKKEGLNPVMTFFHQNVLDQYTYYMKRQLEVIYEGMGGSLYDLYSSDAPFCDLTPYSENRMDAVCIMDAAISGLFLNHYMAFYLQEELSEQEMEWLKPIFMSYLSEKNEQNYYTREQIGYLLWLYEYKRLPVDWAIRLFYAMAQEYNDSLVGDLMHIDNLEEMVRLYGEAYGTLIEEYRAEAKENWAEKKEKWKKKQEEEQAALKESERILALLKSYEKNKEAVNEKFTLLEQGTEKEGVYRYRKIKGMIDSDNILWIAGKGIFKPELLNLLPPGFLETCKAIYIGEGITEIDVESFSGCETLVGVHLPDTIKNIKKYAFYKCRELVYVRTSKQLRYIGAKAFAECKKLRNFKLSKRMEYLHKDAFDNTEVDWRGELSPNCKVLVPVRVLTDNEGNYYYLED
ncbi:MAG: leucine-rich repeat domain-containing protein [Lachnospiraceae bacterium]|nr:leucine-rich repeat domain-containing protein [Lachnospiraceae bacterium]